MKRKTDIICLLFLFVCVWPISFYDIPSYDSEDNTPVKTANGLTEGISNGGFETGNLTDWITGGDHLAWVNDNDTYIVHSGTYGCQISVYGEGHYNDAWIEQNLTDSLIYSDFIDSFSFWKKTEKNVTVIVTYWDGTTTIHEFSGPFTWTQFSVTGLTLGKRLEKVRFATTEDSDNPGGIDDITLIYSKVLLVQKEGISNGGFETGDLTSWATGGDHPAFVSTSTYVVHSGTYGCVLLVYGGGQYNKAWIEQNLTSSFICSDLIESFSFWRLTANNIRLTVTYWDGTTTQHDFLNLIMEWEQHNITGLTPGKRLKKVRFEATTGGGLVGGIDDITLTYNYTSLLPETPVLLNISPDPDPDGDITIDWNDAAPSEYYTVYRHSSLITELNGSVTTLGTTTTSIYTDLGLNEGIYYYAIVAHNDIGTSELSNCESVEVDLPDPFAPTLENITPNPDPDGDITLDWDDVLLADNYTIYRYSSFITELNGSVETLDTVFTSTYIDFDLDEGIYFYVVTATNETGTSGISNCKSVEVDLPGPDKPYLVNILPNPDFDGEITLYWYEVSNVVNYVVYRCSSFITELNGSVETLDTVYTTTYTDLGLAEGIYFYVIRAWNETGFSEISNCEFVWVDLPGPNAPILEDIIPDNDRDGDITLVWNNVPTADLYYVYRSDSFILPYEENLTLIGTTIHTTYEDLDLEDGEYYYAIKAENENGFSELSNCEYVNVNQNLGVFIPGYSIGLILMMMVSFLAIIYYQKFRPKKYN